MEFLAQGMFMLVIYLLLIALTILPLFAGLLAMVYEIKLEKEWKRPRLVKAGFVTGLFSLALVSGLLLTGINNYIWGYEEEQEYTLVKEVIVDEIVSLDARYEPTDRFIIAKGTIDYSDYYYYMVETEDDFEMKKIQDYGQIEIDTADGDFKIIEYHYKAKEDPKWFDEFIIPSHFYEKTEVIIFVPDDYIVEEWQLE
jgi:hypothetical protein